jgi:hypothetical protein
MGVEIRGEPDEALVQVRDALAKYVEQHPGAEVAIRRYGRCSIHLRVIDPGFAKVHRFDRHAVIGPYLDPLPDDIAGYITKILPLAPREVADSWGNRLFEEQVPAKV